MKRQFRHTAYGLTSAAISIQGSSQVDGEELGRLRRRLVEDLRKIDVEITQRSEVPQAPGAKGVDPDTWTSIILALAASGGVLTSVVSVIRDWLLRQPNAKSIEIEIDGDSIKLTGALGKHEERLLDGFLRRHDRKD